MAPKLGDDDKNAPWWPQDLTPAQPFGTNRLSRNERINILKLLGVEKCPQCNLVFLGVIEIRGNVLLIQLCGHMRCLSCIQKSPACMQCANSGRNT